MATITINGVMPDGTDGGRATSTPIYLALAENLTITCVVRDSDGNPDDLDTAALILTIKKLLSGVPVLARQATIADPTTGTGTFSFTPGDTISLDTGKYLYDVQKRYEDGSMDQVVPPSAFILTAAVGIPGEDVTVPESQQPLARGPEGPEGPVGPASTSVSAVATVGTWLTGLVFQDATDANFIRYTPTQSGTTAWYQWAGQFSNGSGHRPNEVMTFGWNQGEGGARVSTNTFDGALWDQFEQYYEAVGGNKVMERHLVYVDPSDQQTRFISFSGGLDSPSYDTSLFITSKTVAIGFGHDPSDMVRQIELTSGATVVRGTDRVANVYMDASQAWISHGDGTGSNLARLTLTPTPGQMYARADYAGYLTSGGSNTQYLSWGPGVGSVLLTGMPVSPGADKSTAHSLGIFGGRYGWVAVSLAAGSLPAANSSSEGMITIVPGTTGVGSTLRAVMKGTNNAYSWVVLATAP